MDVSPWSPFLQSLPDTFSFLERTNVVQCQSNDRCMANKFHRFRLKAVLQTIYFFSN